MGCEISCDFVKEKNVFSCFDDCCLCFSLTNSLLSESLHARLGEMIVTDAEYLTNVLEELKRSEFIHEISFFNGREFNISSLVFLVDFTVDNRILITFIRKSIFSHKIVNVTDNIDFV